MEVSTKSNGVPQSMLKEDRLDIDNSTTNESLRTEVGIDDVTPARVTDTNGRIAVEGSPEGLQTVDLNESQSVHSGSGGTGGGGDSVQGHSPSFNEKLVDGEKATVDPQSTEGDESLSHKNGNADNAANTSVHSEPQSSLEDHNASINANQSGASEICEVSETSSAMETDEKTGTPNTGIPDDKTVTTPPAVEEIPTDQSAHTPPISPEVQDVVSSSSTATAEGSNTSQEIPIATQAMGGGTDQERTESQTSFVNEYALSGSESPTYEVDRSLEQFSEILLDSDPSDIETQAAEGNGDATAKKIKASKKVRFADEVAQLDGRA